MSWTAYGGFLALAVVLVLVPGPDFAVVTRNTLTGGRGRGAWSAVGVATSNSLQGGAAAAGLGALIVQSQPVFLTIKWLGVAYLAYLGLQAWRSAWLGRYPSLLLLVVGALHRARRLLTRRRARRALDGFTGGSSCRSCVPPTPDLTG